MVGDWRRALQRNNCGKVHMPGEGLALPSMLLVTSEMGRAAAPGRCNPCTLPLSCWPRVRCCRWVSQEQAAGGEGGGEDDAPSGISPWELWRLGTSEEIVVYELGTMNRWVGRRQARQPDSTCLSSAAEAMLMPMQH